MSVSNELRESAWQAGNQAAREGKPKDGGGWIRGTIYFDDWHDGYDEGSRQHAEQAREVRSS